MQINLSTQLPGDSGAVADMFRSEIFQRARARVTSTTLDSLLISDDGESGSAPFEIRSTRAVPADMISPKYRGFVRGGLRLEITETWGPREAQGVRRGQMVMKVVGIPAAVTGSLELRDTATGSTYDMCAQIRATIPLMGAKIEAAAAQVAQKIWDAETRLALTYLSDKN